MTAELELELMRLGVLPKPEPKSIKDYTFKDPRDSNGEVPF